MASVHRKRHSGLTLAGYGARLAFALAVVAIGLKIGAAHWPCDLVNTAACQRLALNAGAPPPSPAAAVFAGMSNARPLRATDVKMAAAAGGEQLGAKIAGIARPTAQAPAGS
jgi:hypothetical protein